MAKIVPPNKPAEKEPEQNPLQATGAFFADLLVAAFLVRKGMEERLRTYSQNEGSTTLALPPPREPPEEEANRTEVDDDDPHWLYGWNAIRDALAPMGYAASRQVVQRSVDRAAQRGKLPLERGAWPTRSERVRVWKPDLERWQRTR